jgi:hypothetical protein
VVSMTNPYGRFLGFLDRFLYYINITIKILGGGARGSVVVKALCYKPEGRGFDT